MAEVSDSTRNIFYKGQGFFHLVLSLVFFSLSSSLVPSLSLISPTLGSLSLIPILPYQHLPATHIMMITGHLLQATILLEYSLITMSPHHMWLYYCPLADLCKQ